jgi:hypothetical protein
MSLDILAALEASPSAVTGRRCRIQRFLDNIPADTPGRDQLEATLNTKDPSDPDYRTATSLLQLLARLGETTSVSTVNEHRAKRCVCYA